MQVIISGRGVVLTPAFKSLVQRKVAKLTRVLPRMRDARLVCEAEKFRRTARLVVRGARRSFSAEATAGDLSVAVDEAVEAVDRQARAAKDRRRGARLRSRRAPTGGVNARARRARPLIEPVA